jgi:hypothetical protein
MADSFETGIRSAIARASLRASVTDYHKEADGQPYCDYGFHLINGKTGLANPQQRRAASTASAGQSARGSASGRGEHCRPVARRQLLPHRDDRRQRRSQIETEVLGGGFHPFRRQRI